MYNKFLDEPLWGCVLIPGKNTGWTFVSFDPAYCLCDRPKGVDRPRLAEVARLVECEALILTTYDSSDGGILLEALADGAYYISGRPYNYPSDFLELEALGELTDEDVQSWKFPFYSDFIAGTDIIHPKFHLD